MSRGGGTAAQESLLWELAKCWDLMHNTGRMLAVSGARNAETAALNGACINTHIHRHTRAHMHTHNYTHAHTHTHNYTHAHTPVFTSFIRGFALRSLQ